MKQSFPELLEQLHLRHLSNDKSDQNDECHQWSASVRPFGTRLSVPQVVKHFARLNQSPGSSETQFRFNLSHETRNRHLTRRIEQWRAYFNNNSKKKDAAKNDRLQRSTGGRRARVVPCGCGPSARGSGFKAADLRPSAAGAEQPRHKRQRGKRTIKYSLVKMTLLN